MKELIRFHITQGTIAGVISAIFILVLYLLGVEYLAKWYLSTLIFVIVIVAMARTPLQWRKKRGGFLPYMHAWLGSGIIYVVAMLVLTLFNLLLYNVLHPGLGEELADMIITNTVQSMQEAGSSDAQIEGTLKYFEKMEDNWTAMGMIKSYLWGWILGAILGAIVGAFVFKKEPKHLAGSEQSNDGDVMGEIQA